MTSSWPIREKNRALIAEAVEVARGADVILLAIGDTEQTSREGYARTISATAPISTCSANRTRLFEALHALGKPVVVVAINGRPPSWPTVAAKANAMLECWYAGQEGGTAMAEALFGDVNPGAKLPVTVVRDAGQIPFFYNHKPCARRGYLFDDAAPAVPVRARAELHQLRDSASRALSASSIAPDGTVTVDGRCHQHAASAPATRSSSSISATLIASVTQPVKALKGFERVTLARRRDTKSQLHARAKGVPHLESEMKEVVEPGRVEIMAGATAQDLRCNRPPSKSPDGSPMPKITAARVIVTCPGRNFVTLKIETDGRRLRPRRRHPQRPRAGASPAISHDHVIPLPDRPRRAPDRGHLAVSSTGAPTGGAGR